MWCNDCVMLCQGICVAYPCSQWILDHVFCFDSMEVFLWDYSWAEDTRLSWFLCAFTYTFINYEFTCLHLWVLSIGHPSTSSMLLSLCVCRDFRRIFLIAKLSLVSKGHNTHSRKCVYQQNKQSKGATTISQSVALCPKDNLCILDSYGID